MKNKNYINVTISVLEEDFEIAYAILVDFEFLGMEEKFDEIILSFDEKNWNENVKKDLIQKFSEFLPNAKIEKIEILSEKNWNEEWEKNVQPVIISNSLVITPEWKADDFNCNYKILINPKMSFGTGQHSTTKLMAKMIEEFFVNDKINNKKIFVDAGTGTGILAIISAKFGADKVYAFDNDEWAYENAIENVKLNAVSEQVEVTNSGIDEYIFPKSDCIFANMFLGLIIRSFPKFYNSLNEKGILFISGILLFDRDELLKSATKNGFELLEEQQELEWCCFKFKIKTILKKVWFGEN